MENKIVGEGTYGCVVEPALECKKPENYENKVSKVMRKNDAIEELKEYELLKSIPDINKYTVNVPVLCEPKLGVKFSTVVRECKGKRVRTAYQVNQKNLAILLMENGGLDLNNFTTNIFPKLDINDQNKFLTAILDAIKGVQFFNKVGIIHQDIKAGNMVYNLKTNKLKFIDFGLMITKEKFIRSSDSNQNTFAQTWDYYPPEFSCANFSDFDDLDKCMQYRNDYAVQMREPDYDTFIEDMANTFDSYCLSLALKKLMSRNLPIGYHEASPFFKEAKELFKKYCDENLMDRYDNLDDLINDYRKLLKTYGMYNKDTPTPSKEIIEEAETLSLKSDIFTSPIRPTCPPKRPDYNPKTKKCMPECKEGKIRNANFRCVTKKQTPQKKTAKGTQKIRISKEQQCKNRNKDYNPHTNRCLAPCKPNQRRNEKFRCVSKKRRTTLFDFPKMTSAKKSSKNKTLKTKTTLKQALMSGIRTISQ